MYIKKRIIVHRVVKFIICGILKFSFVDNYREIISRKKGEDIREVDGNKNYKGDRSRDGKNNRNINSIADSIKYGTFYDLDKKTSE